MNLVYKLDRVSFELCPTFWDRRRKKKTIKKLQKTDEQIAYLTEWVDEMQSYRPQYILEQYKVSSNKGKLAALKVRKENLEKQLKLMEWIK